MIEIVHSLFGVCTALFEAVLELFASIVTEIVPSRRKTGYDADFGKADEILEKGSAGFYVGSWSNSVEQAHSHLITLGGSGSGKSSSIVIPTLLQAHECSYIVNDPAKQALSLTGATLEKNDFEIIVVDLNNPVISKGFNALAYCDTPTEAYSLANVIIRNSLEGSSYDYWSQSAEFVIALFIRYLTSYADPKYCSIPNVVHLIRVFSYDPKLIDRLFVKSKDKQLLSQYRSLNATPSKTLQSTLSTALTALRIYEAPNIAALTSKNQIDFDSFRKRKTALFLCSSASDAYLYRSITASFFESFFSQILRKEPGNEGLPITLLIDEASSMKLPTLSQALALTRKHAISIATLWQDYNQIEHLHGKNEAVNIFANSHLKVFMPSGQPLETCVMLEKLLGRYSYCDDEGKTRTRELLTAQEIHELDKMLVLSGNKPPLLLNPNPFYQSKKLLAMTQLPQYIPPVRNFSLEPSLLELKADAQALT